MTYTANRLDVSSARDSLIRQMEFTQIMCAGEGAGEEREFDESKVKRAGGKFATRAEKAKMAEDARAANLAAYTAAEPGEVELPDGTKTYKFTKEESDRVDSTVKGFVDFASYLPKAASSDPGAAVQDLEKQLAGIQTDKIAKEINTLSPEAKKVLAEKTAPVKAQAAAQVTKAIANNMSDDQVKKGLVAVTKQLNSGTPSKPEQVMEMIKGWAAEAQKNIDSGIKAIKSAGSDAKAKALAAGTGLMAKIAEMAAAAQNSAVGKAIGNAANATGKAIGDAATAIAKAPGDAKIAFLKSTADRKRLVLTGYGAFPGANVQGPANKTNAGIIKPAVQGPANKANSQVVDKPSALQSLGQAAAGYAAGGQKNLGNAANSIGKAVNDGVDSAKSTAESAGKTIGDAANSAKKNVNESFSDASQVAKDLVIDGRQTAKRAEIGIKEAKKSTLKTLGNAANSVGKAVNDGVDSAKSTVDSANKTLGDAANSAKKAIGDKVNEAGFSTNIKDLPGDLGQVGKDLVIDGRQTAKRTEIGIKEAKKSTLKTLGNAAKTAADIAKDPELQAALAFGIAPPIIGSLAGAGIGALAGGPAGAVVGRNIGNSLGAMVSGANIGVGAVREDPKYYQKEAGAIRDAAQGAVKGAGALKDRAFKAVGDAAAKMTGEKKASLSTVQGPANKTNAQVIKQDVQGPANKSNAQIVAPVPKPAKEKAKASAKKD